MACPFENLLDHPDADRHPSLVFYLEEQDYAFTLFERDDIRQTHVIRIGAFLACILHERVCYNLRCLGERRGAARVALFI